MFKQFFGFRGKAYHEFWALFAFADFREDIDGGNKLEREFCFA